VLTSPVDRLTVSQMAQPWVGYDQLIHVPLRILLEPESIEVRKVEAEFGDVNSVARRPDPK